MEPEPGYLKSAAASTCSPEGYGEITGGSERMSDPELL